MDGLRTHVDHNGRMLIPAQIRKKLHIKTGDIFVIRAGEGEIKMISLDKAVAEAQNMLREYIAKDESVVNELILSRKQEFLTEQKKTKSHTFKEGSQ